MARKRKNDFPHYLVFALVIVLIFLFTSFNYRIIKEREGNKQKISELETELKAFEERRESLKANLEQVDDDEYIERILREDFLMKKPGEEKVIILTEDEEEEKEEEKEEKGRWERIRSYFPFD